jgi:hypothetical protein
MLVHLCESGRHQTKIIPFRLDLLSEKIKNTTDISLSPSQIESVLFSTEEQIKVHPNAQLIEQILEKISSSLSVELKKLTTEFFGNRRHNEIEAIVLSGLHKTFTCLTKLSDTIPVEKVKNIDEIINIQITLGNNSEQAITQILPAIICTINISNKKVGDLYLSNHTIKAEETDGSPYLKASIATMILLTSLNLFAYSIISKKNTMLSRTNSNFAKHKLELSSLAKDIAAAQLIVDERKKTTQAINFVKSNHDILLKFFRDLQDALANINYLWVDELIFGHGKEKHNQPSIKLVGRMFLENTDDSSSFTLLANERFNKLFEKMHQLPGVEKVSEIKVQTPGNHIISFKCKLFPKDNLLISET